MRTGRPTKLTEDVQQRIVAFIRAGAFEWVAAQAAGVGPATFFRWMQQGARTRGRRRFREFRESVLQARAEARVAAEVEVAKTDPLSWLLCGPGRDRPGEPGWTRQSNVTLGQAPDGEPLKIEIHYVDQPSIPERALREVVDGRQGPPPETSG
jgi:hypothetical protein